jgi:hypothetical protein
MNVKIGDPQRSLLMNKIREVLPRDLWPALVELLTSEHRRGIRAAVTSIRQFREKKGRGPNALASRLYSVPRDMELFEAYLLREGRTRKGRPGRPRKDQEADQIIRLKEEGNSWAQIARKLKKTPDACRQLFRRRLSELEAENKRLQTEIKRLEKE